MWFGNIFQTCVDRGIKQERVFVFIFDPNNYSGQQKEGGGGDPKRALLPETRHLIVLALVCPSHCQSYIRVILHEMYIFMYCIPITHDVSVLLHFGSASNFTVVMTQNFLHPMFSTDIPSS